MRVKIDDCWFEAQPGKPILVELNEQDKENIRNMIPSATKYAIFCDDDPVYNTIEIKEAWMADDAD